MRVRVLPIAALAAVTIVLGGCMKEAERKLAPGTIRVGILMESAGGTPTDRLIAGGAQVAAAELNNAGGIDGVARVQLISEAASGPGGYAAAARALVKRGVRAVLASCERTREVAAAVRRRAVLLAPCAGRSATLPPFVIATGVAIEDPVVRTTPIAGSKLDEFYERYKAIYGTRPASSIPALGYDALKIFAAAANSAGSGRPALIMQQLRDGLDVGGAFGKISYEDGSPRPVVEVRNVRR